MGTFRRGTLGLVLGGLCASCAPAGSPSDAGADASSTPDVPSARALVVRVLGPGDVPIAGATVGIDAPSRVEQLTDADGRASFPVDWGAGTVDVIAWADGYGLRAIVDLTEAVYTDLLIAGALPLRVRGALNPPRITVSGSLLGFSSPANWALVHSDLVYNEVATQDTYSLLLPAGRPFQLSAIETMYVGDDVSYTQPIVAFVQPPPQAASDTNLVVDIDLTMNHVTPIEVSGSFTLPPDPWFDGAYPWIVVGDGDAIVPYGIPTRAVPRADGSTVDYSTAYVLPSGATEITTSFSMNTTPIDGRVTFATVNGSPVGGAQAFTFLTPPVLDPAPGGGFMHVFDEAVVRLVPDAIFTFTIAGGGSIRAEVSGPPGAARVRLPALPAGAGSAGLFVSSDMFGYARLCVRDPSDATGRRCALEALSQSVPVDP